MFSSAQGIMGNTGSLIFQMLDRDINYINFLFVTALRMENRQNVMLTIQET